MGETILLPEDSIKKCVEFARLSVKRNAQNTQDFRSHLKRNETDLIADSAEGKLAELSFIEFALQRAGIEFIPDFRVYDNQLVTDYGNDFHELMLNEKMWPCPVKIDIKASRQYAQWLLIENPKFISDIFIIVRVLIPEDAESNLDWTEKKSVTTIIDGFAHRTDFIDETSKEFKHQFKQGERLFDPRPGKNNRHIGPKLKAPLNFGLPIRSIRNSNDQWSKLFKWIKGQLTLDSLPSI